MATLLKQFTNHFGVDLKSNDINRDNRFATGIRNAQYRKNGNISKREGYRAAASSVGGLGLGRYPRIVNGINQELIVTIDNDLHLLLETEFTVSYTGAALSVVFELFFDDEAGEYRCTIVEDAAEVLNQGLGQGFEELSTFSVQDLQTAINALPNFTASIQGSLATPAAFLEFVRSFNLSDSDMTTIGRYTEQVSSTVASPFQAFFDSRSDETFENASFAFQNNTLFIAGQNMPMHKYDGQNVYRAGLPKPDAPLSALGVAGSLNSPTGYRYAVRYIQIDANGVIIDGTPSDDSTPDVTPVNQSIDVTVNNVEQGSGFNTNCGIAAGAQVNTNTINVDDGSGNNASLQTGDKAYFFDTISAQFVTRNITAATGNQITIDGDPVSVDDNAVISNDLRIGIFRNQDGGLFKFLVAELPNNSYAPTQVFNDDVADLDLGIQLIEPDFAGTLPPDTKYISTFNSQLCAAGDVDNPSLLYFSVPNEPEQWSTALLNLQIGDEITAIGQDNEVFTVFERQRTHIVSGDLPQNNVRVDIINDDIGCVSHHSLAEVRGSLYFLSDRGVFRNISGQQPLDRSELIEPVFEIDPNLPENERLMTRRAVGVNHREKEQYVLFIPAETQRGSDVEANSFSQLIVEDYFRNAWLFWDNMNMAGGAVIKNGELFFQERRFSTFSAAVESLIYRQQNRGDNWDFQDNTVPVNWEYDTAWYHLGEPSIFKKFLRLKLFGIEETENNAFSVGVSIERDFVQDLVAGSLDFDFTETTGGYGINPYGIAPYGDTSDPNLKKKIGPIKAKSLRFLFSNNEPRQNVDMTGWELEYSANYRSELKE